MISPMCGAACGLVDGGSKGERSGPLARPNVAHWVDWLSRGNRQTRPLALGTLCRQNLHARTLRSPIRAVSTTGNTGLSQVFQRSSRGGSASGNGAPIAPAA